MEMEVTWGRAALVWWAYMWRLALCGLASSLAGAVVGGLIGLVMGLLQAPKEMIAIVSLPLGVAIGLASSIIPMKLILGKEFDDFRLVLASKEKPSLAPERVPN